MTDSELLERARAKDSAAWRTLYERYLPLVWRRAHALVGSVNGAEDVTSEVMLALVRSLDQIHRDGVSVAGWLLSVVRRQAAEHHRRAYRMQRKLASAAASPVEAAHNGPSVPLETAETRRQVLRTLDRLPEQQRMVLEWKYVESLSVREMAERMGRSERSIEAILYRARRGFRQLYDSQTVMRANDEPRPRTS